MLGFQSLPFILCSSILVNAPSASAIDRSAVDFVYGQLAETLEAERAGYCGVCTYLCELLQDQEVNDILDPMDEYMRPKVEGYLLPLSEALQANNGDEVNLEDCKNKCSALVKRPLNDKLAEVRNRFQESIKKHGTEGPFPPGVFNAAMDRISNDVESEENKVFKCDENVKGRPDVEEPPPFYHGWILYYLRNCEKYM